MNGMTVLSTESIYSKTRCNISVKKLLESQKTFYPRADRERGRHELAHDSSSVPFGGPEEDECVRTSHLHGS